jgi:dihydrofolate reductase
MSKLRVTSFSISIDGYSAGPNQDLQNPLGVGGEELMEWVLHSDTWRKMHGHDDGEAGVDDAIAGQGFIGLGAWIIGRNMFGPVRGPWPDESWKGWWGIDMRSLGYECTDKVAGERATHIFVRRAPTAIQGS